MKKAILMICLSLVLCGCGSKVETVYCENCNEEVEAATALATPSGHLCPACFAKNDDYTRCDSCGIVYDTSMQWTVNPYHLCDDCVVEKLWWCASCEMPFPVDLMTDLGDGYYLCADCAHMFLEAVEDDHLPVAAQRAEDWIKAESSLISREEYLKNPEHYE